MENALHRICLPHVMVVFEPLDPVPSAVEERLNNGEPGVFGKTCAEHVNIVIVPSDRLRRRSQFIRVHSAYLTTLTEGAFTSRSVLRAEPLSKLRD